VIGNASASGQHGEGATPWEVNFRTDILGCVALCDIEHHDVPINPSYGALKAATINYMAQQAQRWGPLGIRANTVSPGPILIEGGTWDSLRERRPTDLPAGPRRASHQPDGHRAGGCEHGHGARQPGRQLGHGANVVVDGGYTKRVGF